MDLLATLQTQKFLSSKTNTMDKVLQSQQPGHSPEEFTEMQLEDAVGESTDNDREEGGAFVEQQRRKYHTGSWRGCCSFPHGNPLGLILAFVTSLIALILCDAATDVCGFLEASITPVRQDGSPQGRFGREDRKIGINVYEDSDGECISWRKGDDKDVVYDDSDVIWKYVRTFVGIAAVVSLLLLIALGMAACVDYPLRFYTTTAWLYQVVMLLFILSFLVFASDLCQDSGPDCVFHVGAGLMIGGVVFWAAASVLTFALGSEQKQTEQSGETPQAGDTPIVEARRLPGPILIFAAGVCGGLIVAAVVIASAA
jgi:hypothetical protein